MSDSILINAKKCASITNVSIHFFMVINITINYLFYNHIFFVSFFCITNQFALVVNGIETLFAIRTCFFKSKKMHQNSGNNNIFFVDEAKLVVIRIDLRQDN